jgi:uncharacterized repeat protein (TIGR01451 family)
MKKGFGRNLTITMGMVIIISMVFIILSSESVNAGSYDGEDLALAILANQSTLVSSSYVDMDREGCRQATVLSSLGTMVPTDGSTFALFSTGIAGAVPVTTDTLNPGDERGTWFKNKYGHPRDEATLIIVLQVPPYMHYLYYDVQFFSAEYPEYVGSQYNDKLTVTVDSPSQGLTTYVIDVNSGYFVLDSNVIPGTGFDIFAQSGNPDDVDIVNTTPRTPGADAGATDIVPIGGVYHPISPHEQITVTFNIEDIGDNQFDSAAFIDNLIFSGYAKTDIIARKTVQDLNGEILECNDTLEYTVAITNTGAADQSDNPGNEFEDFIPDNTTYVNDSTTATSGTVEYDVNESKIIWNGEIPRESSVLLTFQIKVDSDLQNGTLISNQGTVYWDSNENGTNDATELTDDPYIDDGIDLDGDGETDDDDPTNLVIITLESASTLVEDFSDDTAGGKATQSYFGYEWFETSNETLGSNFEVVSGYYYSTANSFKTKLRSSGSPQYWNYTLSGFNKDIEWWEIWFACGNASEESNLCLYFKNKDENDIAKIRFDYAHAGTEPPMDWVIKLYYWSPVNGWVRLYTDFPGGYLYNGWYKLRIEKNGVSYINYSLDRAGEGRVDFKADQQLGSSFSDLACVEWRNTKNPVVCPMFFWDEHSLGLTN